MVQLPELFFKVTFFLCSRGEKDQKLKNFRKNLESMKDDKKGLKRKQVEILELKNIKPKL